MRGVETFNEFHHLRRPRTKKLFEQRRDEFFFLLGELNFPRRDPDRGRGKIARDPDPGITQRAVDHQAPIGLLLRDIRERWRAGLRVVHPESAPT
jgi:hypothetical protein